MLKPLGWVRPSWADNHIWTLVAFLFLLFCTSFTKRHVQYALIITLLGVLFAILSPQAHHHHHTHPSIWHPHIYVPNFNDFKTALPAAIGQIPLTTLNSILATAHLSQQLLPSEPTPSLAHLGLSLSITNFISFIFGGMPICHGSGGLAGQYRFGARSGASVIFLGTIKLILGLFFANPVVWVVERFPHSLLGIMVVAAGMELAKVAETLNTNALDLEVDGEHGRKFRVVEEEERKKRFSVMLVTVAGILAFKNDAVGFLAGLVWYIGIYWDSVSARMHGGHQSWFQRLRGSNLEREPLL
jgi:xanthine/uracil permease